MSALTIILIIIGVIVAFFVILYFVGKGKSSDDSGYEFESDSGGSAIKSGFDKLLECCGMR